jgi:tRNA-dihydrouridine synthase B
MRIGPTPQRRNAAAVARAAQEVGAAMIVVHGRSRACGFRGDASYETIGEVKAALRIPVVANGDIDSPAKARAVLEFTGADAVMVGRAALARPWLCGEIDHFLATGELLPPPTLAEFGRRIREHLLAHYEFHGEYDGLRSARKRVGWYLAGMPAASGFIATFNLLESADAQLEALAQFFAPGAASVWNTTWRKAA